MNPHAQFATAAELVVRQLPVTEEMKASFVLLLNRAYSDGYTAGLSLALKELQEPMAAGLLILHGARSRLTEQGNG